MLSPRQIANTKTSTNDSDAEAFKNKRFDREAEYFMGISDKIPNEGSPNKFTSINGPNIVRIPDTSKDMGHILSKLKQHHVSREQLASSRRIDLRAENLLNMQRKPMLVIGNNQMKAKSPEGNKLDGGGIRLKRIVTDGSINRARLLKLSMNTLNQKSVMDEDIEKELDFDRDELDSPPTYSNGPFHRKTSSDQIPHIVIGALKQASNDKQRAIPLQLMQAKKKLNMFWSKKKQTSNLKADSQVDEDQSMAKETSNLDKAINAEASESKSIRPTAVQNIEVSNYISVKKGYKRPTSLEYSADNQSSQPISVMLSPHGFPENSDRSCTVFNGFELVSNPIKPKKSLMFSAPRSKEINSEEELLEGSSRKQKELEYKEQKSSTVYANLNKLISQAEGFRPATGSSAIFNLSNTFIPYQRVDRKRTTNSGIGSKYEERVNLVSKLYNKKVIRSVPCLLIRPSYEASSCLGNVNQPGMILYFHANAEDLIYSEKFFEYMANETQMDLLAMEYPSYSVYKGEPSEAQIYEDAESVLNFIIEVLGVPAINIFILGVSMGTSPAIHVATKSRIGAVILVSPYLSLGAVAEEQFGKISKLLLKERFNNLAKASHIKSPTLIIHGDKDDVVSIEQSNVLYSKNHFTIEVIPTVTRLYVAKDMRHVFTDYDQQLFQPMAEFLIHASRLDSARSIKSRVS